MSVEAFQSFERTFGNEEQIQGVEAAVRSIVRIRLLIEGKQAQLKLEEQAHVTNLDIVRQITEAIKELEGELEDALAFLEEFDPLLFQKMKDNS